MVQTNSVGSSEVSETVSIAQQNVAIVGVNRITHVLERYSRELFWPGQNLIGLITLDEASTVQRNDGFPEILGKLSEFKEIVERNGIQKVIIAIDIYDVQKIHEIVQECVRENVDYDIVPQYYDVQFGGALSDVFRKLPRSFELSIVRFMDVFVSVSLLLLLVPIWILISLFIKLSSSGSVLYSQERVGKNGQIFRAYKFRTMYPNFPQFLSVPYSSLVSGLLTPLGRFLKKTGMEDIPLLLNVLSGDMSIIGPEAERPYYHEKYMKTVPFYENRLKVKPGIIGYSQVEIRGGEIAEDIREKLRYDFYYVDHNHSFSLNTKIVLKAIFAFPKNDKFTKT